MIRISGNQIESSAPIHPFNYAGHRKILGRVLLPMTRWLRAIHAEKYMCPAERHLDIGCGDGYFLKRSRCHERIGLDKLLGDTVEEKIGFPSDHFDYVTLLAVIEHLHHPRVLIREIARILKPKGKFIITTPRRVADKIIKIYARDIDEEHVAYYDLKSIRQLTEDYFFVKGHHRFIFGLNQVFCLEKKPLNH